MNLHISVLGFKLVHFHLIVEFSWYNPETRWTLLACAAIKSFERHKDYERLTERKAHSKITYLLVRFISGYFNLHSPNTNE